MYYSSIIYIIVHGLQLSCPQPQLDAMALSLFDHKVRMKKFLLFEEANICEQRRHGLTQDIEHHEDFHTAKMQVGFNPTCRISVEFFLIIAPPRGVWVIKLFTGIKRGAAFEKSHAYSVVNMAVKGRGVARHQK